MSLMNAVRAAQRFACPSCGWVLLDAMDRRFGYCPRCRDFTTDPTDFLIQSDLTDAERKAWTDRVRAVSYDRMIERGPYPPLTDEQRERNYRKFEEEERLALTIVPSKVVPPDTALIGAFGHGAHVYEPAPTRRERFRSWLDWVIFGARGRPTKR